MPLILRIGIAIVVLALACYTVGVVSAQRRRVITQTALRYLILGIVFDVIATVCMIVASGRLITWHGAIGYSALLGMALDIRFVSRHRSLHGDATVPTWLHRYTRFAYAWWVMAFVTGGMLARHG